MSERQHYAVVKSVKGTANPRGRHRVQMAIRPKKPVFDDIARHARVWGVSWNEAALRLIDKGLTSR